MLKRHPLFYEAEPAASVFHISGCLFDIPVVLIINALAYSTDKALSSGVMAMLL